MNLQEDIQRDTANAIKGIKPEVMGRSFPHPEEHKCDFEKMQPAPPRGSFEEEK
jgi:hypothetical protein